MTSSKTVADTIGDVEVETIQGANVGESIPIKSLWENQPVVVHFLRRFGCKLCRAHAAGLEKIVPTLEAKGYRVVAIGIEKLGVEEFQKGGYWKGELYIDNGKNALKALDIQQVSVFRTVKDLVLNKDVGAATDEAKGVPGNLKGDGRQLGGTFVFAKGGDVLLDHRQKNFGDHASNEDILKAAHIDSSTVSQDIKDSPHAGECE